MAQFQIYLMSLRSNDGDFSSRYSLVPISSFQTKYNEYDATNKVPIQPSSLISKDEKENYRNKDQYSTANFIQNNNFCYTYDEKFQVHQNTQRTLTFSMNRDIIRVDGIEKNPFINYLFIGTQLLLVDKYDKHHLMTISKISYEFQTLNTVFKYECQDSFNYQLSRQNTGYEIENNLNDADFIGAQTLDWWVLCKIHPECKISYQYIPLNRANANMQKQSYGFDDYPDFYRTVPFSASGTANSVLIALGELYGLQLKVYERVDLEQVIQENQSIIINPNYGRCEKYYWFEPAKSLQPTGLKYSPYLDLQSFNLEHNSASFSSILNIQSNSLGDDIITVLPSVPSFFRQWFETADWNNSLFVPGLFTSKCQGQSTVLQYNHFCSVTSNDNGFSKTTCYTNNTIWYDEENGCIYIPIYLQDSLGYYPYIKFTATNNAFSVLNISGINNADLTTVSKGYNSKYTEWKLIYKINGETFTEKILYTNNSALPIENIQKYGIEYCFLELPFMADCTSLTVNGKIYFSQYRIPSYEELEFAEIADQIPWLENRLINFNYFYNHAIITNTEHQTLLNIIQNDLRKANAKLLLYTQLYYQAIQTRTKIMANLSAKLDKVGAVFQADLINPFMINGRANTTTEFSLAMSDLFANSTDTVKLINYYEILSDYVNKYFNAEQNFLKNMYLFREYFDAKSNLGTVYNYSFSISTPEIAKNKIITFTNPNIYLKLTKDNQHNPIYIKQDNVYLLYDRNTIINAKNYQNVNLYYFDPKSDNKVEITEGSIYSDKQTYYELQWEVKNISLMNEIFKKEDKYSYFEKYSFYNRPNNPFSCELLDKETGLIRIACYNHCLHTNIKKPTWRYNNGENQVQDEEITPIFVPVTYFALCANFFYQQMNSSTNLFNYTHYRKNDREDYMQNVSKWVSSFDQLGLSGSLLIALGENKNIDSSDIQSLPTDNTVADKIYKQCFPISIYYWKGKAINSDGTESDKDEYHEVPFVNIENASQFYRRVSVSLEKYKNWQIATSVIGTLVTGGGAFLPGGWTSALIAPAIWGICSAVWSNGDKPFNNTGWSFHDVFNCDIDSFQGWNDSTRLLYVKNAEGYSKTKKSSIFAEDVIDGETWVEPEELATIQNSQWGYHEATSLLLSYYSLSARLTSSLKEKYWYETSYYRILTINDYINKNDNFLMLWYKEDEVNLQEQYVLPIELKTQSGTKKIQRLDSTIYYPLKNHITSVSGSDFNWPEGVTYQTLKDLFTNQLDYKLDEEIPYILTDKNGTGAKIIILKEERWGYQDLTDKEWTNSDYDSILKMSAATLYDNETFEKIDLVTKYPELTIGFYINGTEKEDFLPTSKLTSFSDELDYYKEINNEYQRYYTINQLIQRSDTYIKSTNKSNYQSFIDEEKILVNYYIYTQENDSWIMDTSAVGTLKKNNDIWYLTGELIPDKVLCDVEVTLQDFNNYTNGSFWYKYKNSSSNLLMEKAMLIEANLMEYWTSAYYASKNCKFFLPEYWQPVVDQQKNYFSSQVFSDKKIAIENNLNVSINNIQLSNILIPVVRKQPKQWKYQFKHQQISDSIENTRAILSQLNVGDSVSLYSLAENNNVILEMINYLKLDVENWKAVKLQNDYIIYEYESGGLLWTQMLEQLSGGTLINPQFGGWYDMMIRVLKTCNYETYEPTQYYQAQMEHENIWKQIYTQYPNLCYEQSYTNENATSSKELLQMAQWAFKDYTEPENNYNISVIDPNTLKGYQGQELHIGDGIEINVDEIYNDPHSDIYKSLIQYLYITDISYNLRRDDDIQLTVNSIKYSDKVIGQLIKLIR